MQSAANALRSSMLAESDGREEEEEEDDRKKKTLLVEELVPCLPNGFGEVL